MKEKFRKLHSPKELRQKRVEALFEEIKQAHALILFTSSFITHQQFETLRIQLEPHNASVRFVKNTLFKVAAKQAKLPDDIYKDEILFEQTGIIIVRSDDAVEPIKLFVKLFKEQAEQIRFKIAWVDEVVYDEKQVKVFATIPSKPELHARLVSSVVSPLYRLHRSLTSDLYKLAMALQQISLKKS